MDPLDRLNPTLWNIIKSLLAEIHWDNKKKKMDNIRKCGFTSLRVSKISANDIFVKTKYNRKILNPILKNVDSIFFLLVFNSSDFSYVIWFFILRFIVCPH